MNKLEKRLIAVLRQFPGASVHSPVVREYVKSKLCTRKNDVYVTGHHREKFVATFEEKLGENLPLSKRKVLEALDFAKKNYEADFKREHEEKLRKALEGKNLNLNDLESRVITPGINCGGKKLL